VNLAITPLLQSKLDREYFIFPPFRQHSLVEFVGALIVLAGAEWAARQGREDPLS
jgi:hypothetical protein